MIDGIKTGNINIPIQKELDWTISVNENTGEVKNTKTAKYNGLLFIDKGNWLYFKGSLHNYFNSGMHNYNDFTYTDLENTVDDLNVRFGIDTNRTRLENVEFGVNIELPYSPNIIIDSLVLHKGKPFNKFTIGRGVECNHTQYFIKVYNKGHQYELEKNLLRVEIKVIKMQYFKVRKIPIETIDDLLNRATLEALGKLLAQTIDEVLFTDLNLIKNDNLNDKEQLIIARGSNPKYWENLKPNSEKFPQGNKDPKYKRQRKNYYKELEQFEMILIKHSKLKTEIVKKVASKFTDLNSTKRTILPLAYSVNLSET